LIDNHFFPIETRRLSFSSRITAWSLLLTEARSNLTRRPARPHGGHVFGVLLIASFPAVPGFFLKTFWSREGVSFRLGCRCERVSEGYPLANPLDLPWRSSSSRIRCRRSASSDRPMFFVAAAGWCLPAPLVPGPHSDPNTFSDHARWAIPPQNLASSASAVPIRFRNFTRDVQLPWIWPPWKVLNPQIATASKHSSGASRRPVRRSSHTRASEYWMPTHQRGWASTGGPRGLSRAHKASCRGTNPSSIRDERPQSSSCSGLRTSEKRSRT